MHTNYFLNIRLFYCRILKIDAGQHMAIEISVFSLNSSEESIINILYSKEKMFGNIGTKNCNARRKAENHTLNPYYIVRKMFQEYRN